LYKNTRGTTSRRGSRRGSRRDGDVSCGTPRATGYRTIQLAGQPQQKSKKSGRQNQKQYPTPKKNFGFLL